MSAVKVPVYQATQIREFERLAQESYHISGEMMMARAGKAALDFLLRRWPQAKRVLVLCGGGNNGGDGFVLSHLAHEEGLEVSIILVGDHTHRRQEAQAAFTRCEAQKLTIKTFSDKMDWGHPDVIVDAICGIGLHDALSGDAALAVKKLQRARAPIFALDIPSGIDADTGSILGVAATATATITFIGLKVGLITNHGIAYTGELVLNDLQLPSELYTTIEPVAEKIHPSHFSGCLAPRSRDWHKGLSGHVLIIGGAAGYSGAPRMAAQAALRVGAGLVSVATDVANAVVMNVAVPEIMCHGISTPDQLHPLLQRADVVVLGPGMGQSAWAQALFKLVIETDLPLVIDADGLNLLAKTTKHHANWILTPHPGEAATLLGLASAAAVQADRFAALRAITQRYGGVCVLKGAGSVILAPDTLPAICDLGNPGMASAGMGDVLSGVIAGLLAQDIPLGEAAKLGVCIHALAGDLAAKDGERGMVATDLMPFLRRLVNYTHG